MIELVIKMSEKAYNALTHTEFNANLVVDEMRKSIANGTPLPEHHGRLGDLDALEEGFRNLRKELKASDYKNGIEFFVRDEMLLNVQQFIHLCDAIIEGSDAE